MASRDLPDPLQQLIDLIEEAGLVIYYTPPPNRQHFAHCTCTWPDGYPGRPQLNPHYQLHRWVAPAQAKSAAVARMQEEMWGAREEGV
jgi:hypothetical protein